MTEQGSFKKSDSAEGPVVKDAAKTLLSTEQVGASWVDLCFSGETDALQWQITLLCSLSAADK